MSPSSRVAARARRARRLGLPLTAALLAGGLTAVAMPSEAQAAVRGKRGIEIEGARDRRGFYIGSGVGFGGTFFYYDDFIPAMRLDVALGGGVTKKFTLGADLHVTPFLAPRVGVGFGGDIEGTFYVWRGLYLRSGLGVAGVPKRRSADAEEDERGMTVGLGGAFGLGYEFFLNSTAAMSTGFTYDARFIPGDGFPRQSLLLGVRFNWF